MTTIANSPRRTAGDRNPGDPEPRTVVERTIRVDQAGEFGAVRIYEGQQPVELAVVRPTALSPLWHVAGFALGAATALMGEKAAMACTVAIEETIDEHYAAQAAALGDDEAELRATIEKFRAEEVEHRDTALASGAEQAPAYEALSTVIKAGSKLAIWLSTRL
jgi:ubiquinone biosynthesis monooxygenase Coq7